MKHHANLLVALTIAVLLGSLAFVGCGGEPEKSQAKNDKKSEKQDAKSDKPVKKKEKKDDQEVEEAKEKLGSLIKKVTGAVADSKRDQCRVQLRAINQAIKAYYLNVGKQPDSIQNLVQCPKGMPEAKWRGPYLEGGIPQDPWGNPFTLKFGDQKSGLQILLSSNGPDGKPGTADDIKE